MCIPDWLVLCLIALAQFCLCIIHVFHHMDWAQRVGRHLCIAPPVPMSWPRACRHICRSRLRSPRQRTWSCLQAENSVVLPCCSLLGTWSGPGWDPVESTLLQVSLSGNTCAGTHAGLLLTPETPPCSVWCWLAANAVRPPSAAVVPALPACLNVINLTQWFLGWSCSLQVLVSILSMVFVEEPYFNEPGALLDPVPQAICPLWGQAVRFPCSVSTICALLCRL